MAQFSHADFGGMSQWSPGMSMVGDMFNTQLKAKLDALCSDIVTHLDSFIAGGGGRSAGDEVSYRSMSGSTDWWPAGLGRPGAVGAQNDLRYAVFPGTRRLVIDDRGAISVYELWRSPDFRCCPGPKQRPNAFLHEPGRNSSKLRTLKRLPFDCAGTCQLLWECRSGYPTVRRTPTEQSRCHGMRLICIALTEAGLRGGPSSLIKFVSTKTAAVLELGGANLFSLGNR